MANRLNEKIECGIDPREERREVVRHRAMTVNVAHELYMTAVHDGRASRAKRPNKPRTISDKLEIYTRDIAPTLGVRSIFDVTERDLIDLVEGKGKIAKVRANRLAAKLKVFFGWASSLRGLEVGLERNPAARLGDLKFPEAERKRTLSLHELELFLQAVTEEPRDFRRGMLAWLLTAARFSGRPSADRRDCRWDLDDPIGPLQELEGPCHCARSLGQKPDDRERGMGFPRGEGARPTQDRLVCRPQPRSCQNGGAGRTTNCAIYAA